MCAQRNQSKPETNKITISPFSAYEMDRMERIQRFLVNITDPKIASQVAGLGYDSKEHRQGWEDWTIAAGVQVPFEYHLSETKRKAANSDGHYLQNHIRFLDQAENIWFPRARNAIRRFVDPAQRDNFENAFFDHMPQQPEGPGVIGSVEKFMGRLESMKNSSVKGAKEAYTSLQRKGLSDEFMAQLKTTIDLVKKEAAYLPPPDISPDKIQETAQQRREAYDRLNLWYTDWADTFRTELGYHEQVRLGVTVIKGGRSSQPQDESEISTTPPEVT